MWAFVSQERSLRKDNMFKLLEWIVVFDNEETRLHQALHIYKEEFLNDARFKITEFESSRHQALRRSQRMYTPHAVD